jgi:hypothetical protein
VQTWLPPKPQFAVGCHHSKSVWDFKHKVETDQQCVMQKQQLTYSFDETTPWNQDFIKSIWKAFLAPVAISRCNGRQQLLTWLLHQVAK